MQTKLKAAMETKKNKGGGGDLKGIQMILPLNWVSPETLNFRCLKSYNFISAKPASFQ